MPRKIEDKKTIQLMLDQNMKIQNSILASVFIKSKNAIYEGVHVLGKVTEVKLNEIHYTFTNSDSNYRSPVITCALEDITWIEVL